ncbi:MAG: BrnT family toxin [Actinomycetia bacterium]|nr:BrnT family toxin [Actinomycetes bacterium]
MAHEIRWSEEAESHIARHGVDPVEVEVAAYGRPRLVASGRDGTRLIFGTTDSGRHLFAVLAEADGGCDYRVTARDMTDHEKRLFRRRARGGDR